MYSWELIRLANLVKWERWTTACFSPWLWDVVYQNMRSHFYTNTMCVYSLYTPTSHRNITTEKSFFVFFLFGRISHSETRNLTCIVLCVASNFLPSTFLGFSLIVTLTLWHVLYGTIPFCSNIKEQRAGISTSHLNKDKKFKMTNKAWKCSQPIKNQMPMIVVYMYIVRIEYLEIKNKKRTATMFTNELR